MEKKVLAILLSIALMITLVMPSIKVNAEPNDNKDYVDESGEEGFYDEYNEGTEERDAIDNSMYDENLIKVISYTLGKNEGDAITYTELQSITSINIEDLQKIYSDIENININDFSLLIDIPNLQELNLSNALWQNLNGIEMLENLKVLKINGCTFESDIGFSKEFLDNLYIENNDVENLQEKVLNINLDDVTVSSDKPSFEIPKIVEMLSAEQLSDGDKENILFSEVIANEGQWQIIDSNVTLNEGKLKSYEIPVEIRLSSDNIKAIIKVKVNVDESLIGNNEDENQVQNEGVEEPGIVDGTVINEEDIEAKMNQQEQEVNNASNIVEDNDQSYESDIQEDNSLIKDLPQIEVEDKTINLGDKFDPLEGVKVISSEGEELDLEVEVIENQVNTNEIGKYLVCYQAIFEGDVLEKKREITVVKNDETEVNAAPVINAENRILNLGDTFNPLDGVTATDEEDGDITDRVIYLPHTVDVNHAGVYIITYEVTDSEGFATRKTIEITVLEPIEGENEAPIINASDRTIKVGNNFNPLNGVTAYDKEDGNVTSKIKVVENTVDTNNIGKYSVIYEVTDSGGKTASKSIYVQVEQQEIPVNKAPTIYAVNHSIKVGDKFNPYDNVTANDYEDGNITGNLKIIYNNLNTGTAGTYRIVYEVTDTEGYRVTKAICVTVITKSNNRPIIYVDNVTVPLGGKYDPYAMVRAHDAEDGNITGKVVVVYNYVNIYKEGTYKVAYKVTDSMGLSASCVVKITVKNYGVATTNEPPVLYANNISLALDSNFNPLEWVAATDKEDGDISNRIMVISNEVDIHHEGNYHVTYEVIDSAGNKINTVMMVNVKSESSVVEQNVPPVIYADNIDIEAGTYYDPMDGVTALDEEDGNLNYKIIVTENQVDVSKKGIYKVEYSVTDSMGETTTKSINVTVIGNSGLSLDATGILFIVIIIALAIIITIGIVVVKKVNKKQK